MNYTGKILEILPVQTGTTERGDWMSQQIVVSSDEMTKLAFTTRSKTMIEAKLAFLQVGQLVNAEYIPVSNCSKKGTIEERWFSDLVLRDIWRIDIGQLQQ